MPLYQDHQNRLYWHGGLHPLMLPAVTDAAGDWPVIRRVRPQRQATFLILCGVNAVLSVALALVALRAMQAGVAPWPYPLALAAFLLSLLGPGLMMRWAGEMVRFAQPLRLAEPAANGVLWASVALTSAVIFFYAIRALSGGPGWARMAVAGLITAHAVRFGLIWRRVPGR